MTDAITPRIALASARVAVDALRGYARFHVSSTSPAHHDARALADYLEALVEVAEAKATEAARIVAADAEAAKLPQRPAGYLSQERNQL